MKRPQINLRLDVEEQARWQKSAAEAGLSVSEWIRRRCNAEPRVADSVLREVREVTRAHIAGEEANTNVPRVADRSVLERGSISGPGYEPAGAWKPPANDKTCQCGVCQFRREVFKESK